MASVVKINIPGVGNVEATNAATEDTLLKILEAVKKSEATKKKEEKEAKKAADEALKQQQKVTDSTKEYGEYLDVLGVKNKAYDAAKKKMNDAMQASNGKFSEGAVRAGFATLELANTVGSVAKTMLSVATAFLTNYDQMAQDPIKAGQTLMNTALDTTNTIGKGLVNGVGALFGPIGMAVSSGITGLMDAATEALKAANDVMAKEFTKSTDALKSYTAHGASFAGGMDEMRRVANDSGLSISMLAGASKNAANDIRTAGLSQGEGAKKLADGFAQMKKTIGKSGASVSDELMALGYSYQDQMEIQASYMAQLKRNGVDMKNMSSEDLAKGTAEYAKNLKIISDITGQDAKKLQEKAAAETQRASLMTSLSDKQKEAYQNAFKGLEALGPEQAAKAQQALYQMVKTGTTNVIGFTQGPARDMITKLAQQTKAGSLEFKGAMGIMSDSAKSAAAANEGSAGAAADAAAGMGVHNEAIDGLAGSQNALLALNLKNVDEMEKASSDAADKQAALAAKSGSAEQSFIKLTDDTNKFAVEMEKLTGSKLGEYAKMNADLLGESLNKMKEILGKFSEKATATNPAGNTNTNDEALFNAYAGFADGGWSMGPDGGYLQKLHGTELIVPTVGGMLDTNSKGFGDLVNAMGIPNPTQSNGNIDKLSDKIDQLISAIGGGKTTADTGGGDMIANAFNNLSDLMNKHIDISQEMSAHAKDNKDLVQKLLQATI